MADGIDMDALAYLNPGAVHLFHQQMPSRTNRDRACPAVFRGMWKPGVAYATDDVVYICSDYEEPSEENLWRALRTHCAAEEDRPESGENWLRTWSVRLRPGQSDDLDPLDVP